MLTGIYRSLDRTSDRIKVVSISAMIVGLVVSRDPFSWLLLAAVISGGIDALHPRLKRLAHLPNWRPDEAYITKLRRQHRTR